MAKKQKSCIECRTIYEGENCPNCGSNASSENFKGRVYIFNTENSQIAKNMKINKKGEFAIKSK